jgi:TetR/AcrR family transcriptional regulator, fatty acid metabolism regulator protein
MRVETRTKRDVLQEFRKSELLSAARTVFSRKGFHDSTIDDIAAEAGVAKGTVYLYFKSKQEIYLGALRDGIEILIGEMRAVAVSDSPARDKLYNLITTKIAFFDKNRDFFQIVQSEFSRVGTTLSDCKDLYFEQAQIIGNVLKDGITEGVIQKLDTRKTAFAIADLTRGITIQRMLGWSKTRLKDEIDFMFNLLWKGIAK